MAKRINCNVPGCVMHSIMWKGINTLLKALERYAILTTGRQDLRKRGQAVSPWIKEKGEKYVRGWDRRATIILLGASVLLTLYRFIGRRGVFTQFFGKFFIQHPLRRILPYFYWFWMSAVTLLLLPVLVIKFGIKDSLRDYGFRLTHGKLGWGFVLGGWLLMLPLIALVLQFFPAFQEKYPLSDVAGTNWKVFIAYEISYGVYMFCWEFFFRGFMLFGLEKRFGNYSILIQTLPFVVKHSSKPFAEAMGSVVTSILLGVLALETRSFIYGAAVHWLVAMSMDILALAWK